MKPSSQSESTPEVPSRGLIFTRREAAGALGDLGTFIPLLVGMVTQCGLQLIPALLFAGVMNIITGLCFRIPMTVQPMKVIAIVAIAERLSESEILATGIVTGVIILLLTLLGLIDRLNAWIPRSIVRGLQLALGLKLAWDGFWMVVRTGEFFGRDGILLGIVCLGLAVFLRNSRRFPAALIVFVIGLISLIGARGADQMAATGWLDWHVPQLRIEDVLLPSAWRLAVAQVPLTLLNSVVSVCALSIDLFPHRPAKPTRVAFSVGLMNLVCCPLGAMPMCYGAGGLASQYRFGARSGGSLVMLGSAMIVLVLLLGNALLSWLQCYPDAVLGVLLGFSGLELVYVCRDQKAWRDRICMLVTAGACLATNMALGFLAGCAFFAVVHIVGRMLANRRARN